MLAGQPPFTGPTAHAITARKLSESAPNVAVVRDTVPPWLVQALGKALAPVPGDRYASAARFAEGVRRFDAHRPAPDAVEGPPAFSRRTFILGASGTGLLAFAGGALLPAGGGSRSRPMVPARSRSGKRSHSDCSAAAGSTAVARRAGRYAAQTAASTAPAATPRYTTGSIDETP